MKANVFPFSLKDKCFVENFSEKSIIVTKKHLQFKPFEASVLFVLAAVQSGPNLAEAFRCY